MDLSGGRDATIAGFPGSGHDLCDPDPARFHETVRRFLDALDAGAGSGIRA